MSGHDPPRLTAAFRPHRSSAATPASPRSARKRRSGKPAPLRPRNPLRTAQRLEDAASSGCHRVRTRRWTDGCGHRGGTRDDADEGEEDARTGRLCSVRGSRTEKGACGWMRCSTARKLARDGHGLMISRGGPPEVLGRNRSAGRLEGSSSSGEAGSDGSGRQGAEKSLHQASSRRPAQRDNDSGTPTTTMDGRHLIRQIRLGSILLLVDRNPHRRMPGLPFLSLDRAL